MLGFIKKIIQYAKLQRLRRVYRPGRTLSRFIAIDIRREVEIVSADEIQEGLITAKIRTTNLLYRANGLVKEVPFGPPERVSIDELWTWSGQPWGGLPDGTSIAGKTESKLAGLDNDA